MRDKIPHVPIIDAEQNLGETALKFIREEYFGGLSVQKIQEVLKREYPENFI